MKSLLVILFSVFIISCGGDNDSAQSDTPLTMDGSSQASPSQEAEYAAGELTNYQGEALDPLDSFRENSIKGVQYIDSDDYKLSVTGLVDNPLELSYAELLDYPSRKEVVTVYCVEGLEVNVLWEGIPLSALFEDAELQSGANTVIFHAADGYTTSLSLDFISNQDLMIAYQANGIRLPENLGYPFILVAEEKWGYKWARWIQKIELSDDESYRGYWESRGYDNQADLEGSFWESD